MENNINLKPFNVRTDLVVESIDASHKPIKTQEKTNKNIKISTTDITKEESKVIEKKEGRYITITFKDITNYEDREEIGKALEKEIKSLLKYKNIKDDDEGLILGLGNSKSTPDALGPKVVSRLVITRHLFKLNALPKEGIRSISAISPGVMGETGIETADYIEALTNLINPQFIIVIDALAASSLERVNHTIQLTDTGIRPGSGVYNNRKEISTDTLKIPVIAIGVPTVVESSVIVNESINYLLKHISYIKNNTEINKLSPLHFDNYIDKIRNLELSQSDKEKLMGLVGTLGEIEKRNLIKEVMSAVNYDLIVCPKEVDFLIDKISDVISSSLNNALHRQITHY